MPKISPRPQNRYASGRPDDRFGVRDDVGQRVGDGEHAERDDERRQPAVGDDQSVGRTDEEADQERGDQPKRDMLPAIGRHQQAAGHGRERGDATHGKVDAAGENHERLADGDDADGGDLPEDIAQVAGGQEVRREHAEDDAQQRQRAEHGQLNTVRVEEAAPALAAGGGDAS